MSRRKKSNDETPQKPEPSFRNTGLAAGLGDWKTRQPAPEPPKKTTAPKPSPPPPKRSKAELDAESEDAFFLRAMSEVTPVEKTPRQETVTERTVRRKARQEDAESLAELAELVAEGEGLDPVHGGGVAKGAQTGLVEALLRGDFSVQAKLELPGLTADTLQPFLNHARREGLRCVRVTVDPSRLAEWTKRPPLSRMVLAYATEQNSVLLLLRR